jgi:hypothetical protein
MGGTACQAYTECCSLTCDNQVCTSCGATSQTCSDTSECCNGLTCYGGKCNLCKEDETACSLASDCCSNICQNGVCKSPDATCQAKSTGQACAQCCQTTYAAGSAFYINALKGCACGASGKCSTECAATLCTGNLQLDQACSDCLSTGNGSTCSSTADTACQTDPGCTSASNCVAGCPQF